MNKQKSIQLDELNKLANKLKKEKIIFKFKKNFSKKDLARFFREGFMHGEFDNSEIGNKVLFVNNFDKCKYLKEYLEENYWLKDFVVIENSGFKEFMLIVDLEKIESKELSSRQKLDKEYINSYNDYYLKCHLLGVSDNQK